MSTVSAAVSAALGINLFATLTDPAWATPANTLLLIVLGFLALRNHKSVEQVARKTDSAAESAASAAQAAADAARIAKDIGGRIREGGTP